jgi:hypothetical protein
VTGFAAAFVVVGKQNNPALPVAAPLVKPDKIS